MGEGGAVGPPAAIANAVRSALRHLGVEVNATPIRPDELLAQLLAPAAVSPKQPLLLSDDLQAAGAVGVPA
jgi:carbon-monoxide dehydrogenase large subunit